MPKSAPQRVAERLRQDITSGRLPPGARLPSRRVLQARLVGSSVTIQAALDELDRDGLIVVRSRHGTYVSEHPPHLCRYGLVMPSLPDTAGRFASHYLEALRGAAARVRRGGRRVVLHVAASQDPGLLEHQHLRQTLARRTLAGLILPAPWVADRWLQLDDLHVPVAVTAPTLPGRNLTKVTLDQRLWFDAALDAVAARGARSVCAMLVADADFTKVVAHLEEGARRRGLVCLPRWVMAVDQRWPEWAYRCALALCHPHQEQVPEALLIADDHLVPEATRGVVASGLLARHRLTMVGHGNLPALTASAVPILRLCWDLDALLDRCIVLMDEHREHGQPSPMQALPTVLVEPDG